MITCQVCGDETPMEPGYDGFTFCPPCFARYTIGQGVANTGHPPTLYPCPDCGLTVATAAGRRCAGCWWLNMHRAEQRADSYFPRNTVEWQVARVRALAGRPPVFTLRG